MKFSEPPEKSRQAAKACRPQYCSFCLPAEYISTFYPLLAQGFFVPIKTGSSIKELLCNGLGWDIEFIQQRIQTIFMEGRTVDDIDGTSVQDGGTLAVSGAMPGVLGAIVRKGSYYSAMRSQITGQGDMQTLHQSQGRVKVKLFNVIAKEKAADLFDKGVIIMGRDFRSYMMKLPESFLAQCNEIRLEQKPADMNRLLSAGLEDREILLQIHKSAPQGNVKSR